MRAARPPLSYLATHSTACSDALSTPDTLVGGSTPPTSIGWLSPDSDGRLAKEHPSPHITPALSSAASMPSVSPDPFATVPSMPTSLLEDPYLSLSAAANPSFNPFLPSSVPFLSAASDSQPGSTGMLDFLLAPDSACIGIPSAALPMSDSVAPGLTESCTAAPAAFTVPSVGNGGSPPQTGQPLGGFDRVCLEASRNKSRCWFPILMLHPSSVMAKCPEHSAGPRDHLPAEFIIPGRDREPLAQTV